MQEKNEENETLKAEVVKLHNNHLQVEELEQETGRLREQVYIAKQEV